MITPLQINDQIEKRKTGCRIHVKSWGWGSRTGCLNFQVKCVSVPMTMGSAQANLKTGYLGLFREIVMKLFI